MASKPRQPHVKLNAEVYLKLSAVRDQIDPDKIPESMGLATIISGRVVALAGETQENLSSAGSPDRGAGGAGAGIVPNRPFWGV